MRDHLGAGALAGLISGIIMGLYIWLGFQGGLFMYNPCYVLASVLLPDTLAVTSTGTIIAIVVHLAIASIIGLLFALFAPEKQTILWGFGLGLMLQLFFGALMTPAFTFVPPFWEMDTTSMVFSFSQRLLFGVSLGLLYGFWQTHRLDREKALS